MSEIKRFNCYAEGLTVHFEADESGDWISAQDALAREAAPLEELAIETSRLSVEVATSNLLGQQRDALQLRLTAAEQRNAEASASVQLAAKLLDQTLAALNPTAKLAKNIREFLDAQRTKPTESEEIQ